VREHDDRTRAELGVIRVVDETADLWCHTEHAEVRTGHELAANGFSLAASREIHGPGRAAEYAVEERRLRLELAAQRI